MGLRPNPSVGVGKTWLKGFEESNKKIKKPIIITC